MRTGILYICTGRYSMFFDTFYKSAETYFLPNMDKKYIVFTDSKEINESNSIIKYYEISKGFPMDSLLRFEMFLKAKEDVSDCDYLFFFNANVEFVNTININMFFPNEANIQLFAVSHPGYYSKKPFLMPFEKREKSTAYLPYKKEETYQYVIGAINGGQRDVYLDMVSYCANCINTDKLKGIIAIYHDESHFNKYIHNKQINILSPSFCYPEDASLPFKPHIKLLSKVKHGGKYFDKLPKKAYTKRILLIIKRTYRSILWIIGA